MPSPHDILRLIREEYTTAASSLDATPGRRAFCYDAINTLLLSEAALCFSPAASLTAPRPLTECTLCGEPITKISAPFKDTISLDYGHQLTVVTDSGDRVSGGLHAVVIRNESGPHVGLFPHSCAAKR